eukprot:scaffold486227_cov13-Prasinocladus_malaysianus.AAC.1
MGRVLLADADKVGSYGAPGHHFGPERAVETSVLPLVDCFVAVYLSFKPCPHLTTDLENGWS